MAEFDEKLNAILGNQEAMGQIMALARSLSGGGEETVEDTPPASHPDSSDLRTDSLLSGLDPNMVQMGLQLIREFQAPDDRKEALLQALRPFLREERRQRLDRAVQIARMSCLIRKALGAMGEKGDEEGV